MLPYVKSAQIYVSPSRRNQWGFNDCAGGIMKADDLAAYLNCTAWGFYPLTGAYFVPGHAINIFPAWSAWLVNAEEEVRDPARAYVLMEQRCSGPGVWWEPMYDGSGRLAVTDRGCWVGARSPNDSSNPGKYFSGAVHAPGNGSNIGLVDGHVKWNSHRALTSIEGAAAAVAGGAPTTTPSHAEAYYFLGSYLENVQNGNGVQPKQATVVCEAAREPRGYAGEGWIPWI